MSITMRRDLQTPIRVTEVLDYFATPWLVDWKLRVGKREANRISKEAMKIGSRVDEIIKNCPIDPFFDKEKIEVTNCIDAYYKWMSVYKPKSITPCTRLYATIDGIEVTGEPDLMVDDVLVDIKCSSKISPNYWVQVNIYSKLMYRDEVYNVNPFKVAILRLDKKTGSYEYVVKDYDPNLVDVWRGLLKAYCYYKERDDDGVEL